MQTMAKLSCVIIIQAGFVLSLTDALSEALEFDCCMGCRKNLIKLPKIEDTELTEMTNIMRNGKAVEVDGIKNSLSYETRPDGQQQSLPIQKQTEDC